ncbi:unnamed protein product, partial [marine sediment metagenome]
VEIEYPQIHLLYKDASYIERLTRIGEDAEKMGVKLLNIKYPNHTNIYLAYIDKKTRIKALTYKYFYEIHEIKKQLSYYIYGVLFGYAAKDIRGYYLRLYILTDLPNQFKKPLEKIESENGDVFVRPEEFYDRRYDFIKDKDNFADFNKKFKVIKIKALEEMRRVSNSRVFEKFVKKHIKDIINYKFNKKKMFAKMNI